MSYRTLEVELENGRVRPSGAETLPVKARALLTIISATSATGEEAAKKSFAESVEDSAGIGRGPHADLSSRPASFVVVTEEDGLPTIRGVTGAEVH
jgi:hypothetical protein